MTLRVGKGMPYTTIKKALEQARPFDTVLVSKGLYFEKNLVINKPIILIGIERPVLDGENKYEVISITASHVTVKGFEIRHSGVSSIKDMAGIKVYESRNVTIEDNRLIDVFFGIYLQYGVKCTIKKNMLISHALEEQKSGNGIHCWNSDSLLITENTITGHRDGIYFEFVKHSDINQNRSQRNLRYGLHFMFSDNDTYRSNIFTDNGAGVAVMFSRHVHMKNNTFKHNWGDAAYGILLKEISDSKIENSLFAQNTTGIYMEGASRVDVLQNRFQENGWAFKIQASCMDVNIHQNNFKNNTFDISTNGRLVLNNFDDNYWDKYEGYDLNRDGKGDIPYRPVSLFSMILEKNATALVMFRSFISIIMDRAEKLIPSLTAENLADRQPLMKPLQL